MSASLKEFDPCDPRERMPDLVYFPLFKDIKKRKRKKKGKAALQAQPNGVNPTPQSNYFQLLFDVTVLLRDQQPSATVAMQRLC